eukprot:COSAG06_NODE_1457_length_9417_cov_58.780425_4_plen_316_part_00
MTSGAAGVYVGTLLEDAGISTDLTITPGQTVSVSGDPSLPQAPSWGGGGFTVQERGSLALAGVAVAGAVSVLAGGDLTLQSSTVLSGSLSVTGGTASLSGSTLGGSLSVTGGTASLSGCTLEDSMRLTTFTDSSLSLASMAVPAAVLAAAQVQLSGAGSTLRLAAVTVPELPDAGELTGTMTVAADGSKAIDPPNWGLTGTPTFVVLSGPCAVSEGGRCVGRPGGYLPSEACEIAVGGGGGVLGACGVFDTFRGDYVTLPDGSSHGGSDCPAGAVLAAGGSVGWASDGSNQGNNGNGLPYSGNVLGGGWQICFAA